MDDWLPCKCSCINKTMFPIYITFFTALYHEWTWMARQSIFTDCKIKQRPTKQNDPTTPMWMK